LVVGIYVETNKADYAKKAESKSNSERGFLNEVFIILTFV